MPPTESLALNQYFNDTSQTKQIAIGIQNLRASLEAVSAMPTSHHSACTTVPEPCFSTPSTHYYDTQNKRDFSYNGFFSFNFSERPVPRSNASGNNYYQNSDGGYDFCRGNECYSSSGCSDGYGQCKK